MKTPFLFAIYRLSSKVSGFNPAITEQVCKPNSVLQAEPEVAIIHLAQPLPAGSSDLPGGRSGPKSASGGQPWLTPPYLVLHREEFAWPRMSPRAPVRSYRTISPITSRPDDRRGWFVFCCTCRRPACQISRFNNVRRPAVSGLAALWCSDFPLPAFAGSDRPTCSHARLADYSNKCSTGIVSA